MLAITSTTAYEICVIKKDGICIDSYDCTDTNYNYIADLEGNKCANSCENNKILLLRENMCNDTCDESIYVLLNNQCGLCKQLFPNTPYKLINTANCYSEDNFPEGVEIYNPFLYLLKCKKGYKLKEDICVINCYQTCKNCLDYSEDETDQKCISCKENYFLHNGNCIISITTIPTTIPITIPTTIPPTITTTIPTIILTILINYFIQKGLNETKCPKKYPYYNIINNNCIIYCDIYNYLNKTCKTDHINNINKENNINNIKNSILSHLIDPILDNIIKLGEYIIIEEEGIKYHLTSTSNQNEIIYKNISNIYLGQCENKLKEKYNINLNQSLLIFKVDIDIEGYPAPIVEYEIYHPITKEKLDLSCCNEEQIKISIPTSIDINENDIKKYDPKSEFYNDICFIYTTESNTDITLKDRQNEFINNNMSLCENNCNFTNYNTSLKKVDCECTIKNEIKNLFYIKIDIDKLKSKFDFRNMINIEVIKCYKKLFCKEGILYNIGSYILLIIILLFIFGLIIFKNKEFASLKKEIDLYIKSDMNNENNMNHEKNINNINVNINDINTKIIVKKRGKKLKKKKKKKAEKFRNDSLIPSKEQMISNFNNKEQKLNLANNKTKNNNINFNNIITENNDNNNIKHEKVENNDNAKKVMNDYELNECNYKEAIIFDKRTYIDYFCSLLKINHILLFVIIPTKDYNSKIIKFCLFLFSFALNLTIETLFYNEETMHTIYEIEGIYDIIKQISQIIYSSIISSLIDIIIKYFALSQKYIIKQKNNKSEESNELKYKKIINCLYKKFIFFYIFTFLLLLFFWYYISCFCAVYKNTQIHLLIDVSSSFAISLLTPFFIYLLPGIFRISSLKTNTKRPVMYKFSQLLQLL